MDANEPGLFDLPDREWPGTANRPLHGRNRETWVRTATVEVTVINAGHSTKPWRKPQGTR
jgi:hypothetical protein